MSCWYEESPLMAIRIAGVAMTRMKRVCIQDVGRRQI